MQSYIFFYFTFVLIKSNQMARKVYRKMKRIGEDKEVRIQKKLSENPQNYFFKEKASSYLKYFRIVRKYIQKKYELTLSELEIILFLYDEHIFNKETFNGFSCTLGFSTLNWISKFEEREIIKVWREGTVDKKMYVLTHKYKMACAKMYKHLEGEPVPQNVRLNPLFKSNVSFSDKMYARLIKKMNEKRKGVE